MLEEIFKALAITSFAGSALTALLVLLRPVTKHIFGYSWHYYIWLTVLITLLLPVRFSLTGSDNDISVVYPQEVRTEQITETGTAAVTVQSADDTDKTAAARKTAGLVGMMISDHQNLLAAIWLLGAIGAGLINMTGYIRAIGRIHRSSAAAACPEIENYTNARIAVRIGTGLSSPFMLGVFRPVLILPDIELSAEQLRNILLHEMTHFRRKDILYKWFAVFVRCVHWFNPIVYYAVRQINTECEISCDLSVVSRMDDNEKLSYVDTILSLVSGGRVGKIPLTTQMASGKKALKRRFTMIRNIKKTSKAVSAVSAVFAAAMLTTTVFASGVLSGLTNEDHTIEITCSGEKIDLVNKPFIENGEVYVPLRETLEKCGVMGNDGSYINWDNGRVLLCLAAEDDGDNAMQMRESGEAGAVVFLFSYAVEIGKEELIANAEPNLMGQDISRAVKVENAPVLRSSNTYVPYYYIYYMLSSIPLNIDYTVYDREGNAVGSGYPDETFIQWEPEPEIFDYSSEFLRTEAAASLAEAGYSEPYTYEFIRHVYNDKNDKVYFIARITSASDNETSYLRMLFENKNNEWVRYDAVLAGTTADISEPADGWY